MRKLFFLIALLLLTIVTFAQHLALMDSVRGLRYCEIIVVTGNLPKLKATVYNTIGCNSCPNDQWKN